MNRRLFWKIFLPFWLAQAVLLGALYLRIHYRISSEHPWWIQPERREMPVLADYAAKVYEKQGQAGLAQLLDSLSLQNRSKYWLVDANGHELSGRPIPERVLRDASAAEKSEGLHHSFEANVLAASTATAAGTLRPDRRARTAKTVGTRPWRHPVDLEVRHHLVGHHLSS